MTTPDDLNNRSSADSSSINNKAASSKHPKKQLSTMMWWPIVILTVVIFAMIFYMSENRTEEAIETITREGVVTQIQKLDRLQTVAFSVDTVITSQRPGSWSKLWQDEQKGLFIARGRVEAGIDLSALTPEMVQVVHPMDQINANTSDNNASAVDANVTVDTPISIMPQINITLPPSEIFSVYLDDIEIFFGKQVFLA